MGAIQHLEQLLDPHTKFHKPADGLKRVVVPRNVEKWVECEQMVGCEQAVLLKRVHQGWRELVRYAWKAAKVVEALPINSRSRDREHPRAHPGALKVIKGRSGLRKWDQLIVLHGQQVGGRPDELGRQPPRGGATRHELCRRCTSGVHPKHLRETCHESAAV